MPQKYIPFDIVSELDSDEAIAEYLRQVFSDGDADEIIRALGHVARARGMTKLAADTGLGRETSTTPSSPVRNPVSTRSCAYAARWESIWPSSRTVSCPLAEQAHGLSSNVQFADSPAPAHQLRATRHKLPAPEGALLRPRLAPASAARA